MEQELSKYVITNWETILSGLVTFFIASIVTTWAVGKMWYTRQLAISSAECKYLEKKNEDKDSYVGGVLEVMAQRVALAEEEPKRLKLQIKEKELLLHELRKDNKNLFAVTQHSASQQKIAQSISNMTILTIRSSLRQTISINAKSFPSHDILVPLHSHFFKWDEITKDVDTDLGEVASFMTIYCSALSIQSTELDIGLNYCYKDLRRTKSVTFDSVEKILRPFIENKKNLKPPSIEFIYARIPSHQLEYYIELAEQQERDRIEKDREHGESISDTKNEDEENYS